MLLLLPGDGIGPEVVAEAARVAAIVAPDLRLETANVGGAAIDACGEPLPQSTLDAASAADAVLLGAVGGPKWGDVARESRPEAGLLALRRHLGVFANLRPAFCFPALVGASSLKPERLAGLDILFVRELTGGIYFGEPRGIERIGPDERRGVDTQCYTSSEIRRVARVAFEAVRARGARGGAYPGLVSVDKANVLESGLLWREEVTRLHCEDYADLPLAHLYGDACAMELVRTPNAFNVILADNLFGDVLSDQAAMLTGSIGMLPSAALGRAGSPGLYEPVHGSAPDIAGRGIANPSAAIMSLAMAMRHGLGRPETAGRIHRAVSVALDSGARTIDLGGGLSTSAMADAIIGGL